MGIRGRLLLMVVGATVPLALLGLLALQREWTASRQQLNESVEQEAELASVILARWFEAQQQPLVTIISATGQSPPTQRWREMLRVALSPRRHWLDVRVVDETGAILASEPPDAQPLPEPLTRNLLGGVRSRRTPVVETDWTRSAEPRVLAVAVPADGGRVVIARLDAASMEELFRDIRLPSRSLMTVLDPQQRIVYRSRSPEVYVGASLSGSTLLDALGENPSAVVEVESPVDGEDRIYGLARVGATGYVVTVGVPSATLYSPARRKLALHTLASLAAFACAATAALLIARGIARPLRRLSRAADRFGAGDLAARAPGEGSFGEVARLGSAFNRMAGSIEEREERLKELDRLKSDFVSSVSHELRTPLTTIKTLTRVMMRDGHDEAARRRYLETIAAQCDRQIDLVLNLLDLSRIESGALNLEPAEVDAAEVIRACVKAVAPAAELRGHTLRAELPPTLPAVRADRSALRRVLCSLAENAIKYTPDGGLITLGVRDAGGSEVEFTVGDTGRGIAPDDLPHVFDKFYRGRQGVAARRGDKSDARYDEDDEAEVPGVGLGLYLARNLAEQMGGRVGAQSEPGRGSTFTVRLPVWRGAEEESREEVEVLKDGEALARR